VKKLLPFLVRLLVISLLFVPVLPLFHRSYKSMLLFISTAAISGQEVFGFLPYDSSNNLYTFLVLILGIPGVALRKRIIGIVTGIGLFLFADFFMTVVWPLYLKTPGPSLANMAVSYGWLVVAHYLLPFLLWFAFAFREIEQLFRGAAANEKTPHQMN
jgi:hypothetical protein